ncbi:hypothetical protein PSTT_09906 [Puccinia striiformis]|uniref:Uncharacterized protein n=1 Tax=Puccinia striiformis TaxID=27350 RepID=A0A2S4V6I8_9BASI|nr:hypothetical protein PSTT_09906 [Puccinia striiformis]
MNAMGCTRASLGLIYSEGCGPDSLRGQAKHARHSVPIWCQPWLDPAMGLTAMSTMSYLHHNKECGRVNSRQIQQEMLRMDCGPPGRIGKAEQSTTNYSTIYAAVHGPPVGRIAPVPRQSVGQHPRIKS